MENIIMSKNQVKGLIIQQLYEEVGEEANFFVNEFNASCVNIYRHANV